VRGLGRGAILTPLETGCERVGVLTASQLNTLGSWLFWIVCALIVVGIVVSVGMITAVRAFGMTYNTRKGAAAIAVLLSCALALAVVPQVLSAHATCSVSASKGKAQPVGLKPSGSSLPQLPEIPEATGSVQPSITSKPNPVISASPAQTQSPCPTASANSRLSVEVSGTVPLAATSNC